MNEKRSNWNPLSITLAVVLVIILGLMAIGYPTSVKKEKEYQEMKAALAKQNPATPVAPTK